jgi:acyl-coenzyme A thioesterase PaaI-like protein
MTNDYWPPWTPERREELFSEFAKVPYPQHLGIELAELGPGTATLTLPVSDQLRQNLGVVHDCLTD